VTLWSVRDDCVAAASQCLLRAALTAQALRRPFACVQELHEFHRDRMRGENAQERIERCALALYL
jgi:hypothetical protein